MLGFTTQKPRFKRYTTKLFRSVLPSWMLTFLTLNPVLSYLYILTNKTKDNYIQLFSLVTFKGICLHFFILLVSNCYCLYLRFKTGKRFRMLKFSGSGASFIKYFTTNVNHTTIFEEGLFIA